MTLLDEIEEIERIAKWGSPQLNYPPSANWVAYYERVAAAFPLLLRVCRAAAAYREAETRAWMAVGKAAHTAAVRVVTGTGLELDAALEALGPQGAEKEGE